MKRAMLPLMKRGSFFFCRLPFPFHIVDTNGCGAGLIDLYRQTESSPCLQKTWIKLIVVSYLDGIGRHAEHLISKRSNIGRQWDHELQQLAQIMSPWIFDIVLSQDGFEAFLNSLLRVETGCIQGAFRRYDGVGRDQVVGSLLQ